MPWPIPVVALSPASCGSVLWREGGALRVTIIVKATYALEHGRDAWPAPPEPIATRSTHRSRIAPSSLVEAPETAAFLAGAGVVLHGHAHAPEGQRVTGTQVRLAVFREQAVLDKTLHVFGDRDPVTCGDPQPFDRIPIVYERAYGGLEIAENPVGVGGGELVLALPNIVDPADPLRVAGFGPVAAGAPGLHAAPADQQLDTLGCDEWLVLEGLHPVLPELQTRLPSARALAVWHRLTPEGPSPPRPVALQADTLVIDADRLRCSIVWRGHFAPGGAGVLDELRVYAGVELPGQPLRWPEPREIEATRGAPVARAIAPRAAEATPEADVALAAEAPPADEDEAPRRPLTLPPLPDDDIATLAERTVTPFGTMATPGIPEEAPAPRDDGASRWMDEEDAFGGGRYVEPGMTTRDDDDPPAQRAAEVPFAKPVEPPARLSPLRAPAPERVDPAREKVIERLAAGDVLDDSDLSGVDLSGLDFTGLSLARCNLRGARLMGSIFASAVLAGAQLGGADLECAVLDGADLSRADLRKATLTGARFDRAKLVETNFTGAEGVGASFQGAKGQRTIFARGRWDSAVFADLEVAGADFTGAALGGATFEDAALDGARFGEAHGQNVRFDGANLARARLEGAALRSSSFDGVAAAGAVWDKATLDGSTMRKADLQGASLVRTSCAQVDFSGANLADARLRQAEIAGAVFRGAKLEGAKLQRIAGDAPDFQGANLDGADLRHAVLHGASFVDATMRKGWADNADLAQSRFVRADLRRSSFRAATLRQANLAFAQLDGVDLRDADLERANLQGAVRTGAKTTGARMDDVCELEPEAFDARVRGKG